MAIQNIAKLEDLYSKTAFLVSDHFLLHFSFSQIP